ncbi:ABC transporter substrate-binding protein [Dactylosporangium sp. CA-092794]|uniref:ABC transporter substrate-binding protein n=1 Tax=Dactylosporangium sp. CA-092794 TaxID=3239929 RepID=UPI003D9284A5
MTRMARTATSVVSVVAMAALVAACGAGKSRDHGGGGDAGSTVGVTDTTIKLGGTFPLTGLAAPGYNEIPDGAQAFYKFINANGGVNGRKIEYIVKDDAYNPTNTSTVTNELVQQDQVFAMVGALGTPTHNAVIDRLNSEKIPDLFVTSGSPWGSNVAKQPMTFGWQPDYEIEGKIAANYVKQNMPTAKVGLFLQDDDIGEYAEKGVREILDGSRIVSVQKYTAGTEDVGPQIAALQAAKPDIVLAFDLIQYTALSQLAALKLNFHPTWYYGGTGSNPQFVSKFLEEYSDGKVKGASLLDGVLSSTYMPVASDTDDPWIQLWEKIWKQYGNGQPLNTFDVYGLSQAYSVVSALTAAGKDLTREKVVKAIEKAGASWPSPAYGTFRWSKDSHMGMNGLQVIEFKDGVGVPKTPVLVTNLGDAPITEDDSAAKDAPPADGIPHADVVE